MIELDNRICRKCRLMLPFSSFLKNKRRKSGYDSICKECFSKSCALRLTNPAIKKMDRDRMNEWERNKYATNAEFRANRMLAARRRGAKYKEAAVNVYTDGKGGCVWCGNADLDVLCFDHIVPIRQKIRRLAGSSLARWLCFRGYPEGFQVLCCNCNMKKAIMLKRGIEILKDSSGTIIYRTIGNR